MKDIFSDNLHEKAQELKRLGKLYKSKSLSLVGKVTVIKTLMIPKLIHILSVIPSEEKAIYNTEKLILDFLWDGKPPKISYNQLSETYEHGSLKLTSVKTLVKALRISWIKRLITSDGLWQSLANNFMPVENTSLLWGLNPESFLVSSKNMKNKFCQEVVTAWGEYKIAIEHTGSFLGYTFLFFSTYVHNRNILYRETDFISHNCTRISDLL